MLDIKRITINPIDTQLNLSMNKLKSFLDMFHWEEYTIIIEEPFLILHIKNILASEILTEVFNDQHTTEEDKWIARQLYNLLTQVQAMDLKNPCDYILLEKEQ